MGPSSGIAATLALATGILGAVAAGFPEQPAVEQLFGGAGLELPWPTRITYGLRLDVVAPLVGLLAAGGLCALPHIERSRAARLGAALLLAPLLATLPAVLHHSAMRYGIPVLHGPIAPPAGDVGQVGEVAAAVADGVRAALERPPSRIDHAGVQRDYVVLQGPGLPPPPLDPPGKVEALLAEPGRLPLPWGSPGALDPQAEVRLFFPAGATPPGTGDLAATHVLTPEDYAHATEDGVPAIRFPATVPAEGELSWALVLQRGRAPDRVPLPMRAFCDDLLVALVYVFRGFDGAANPPRGSRGAIPVGNVPVASVVVEVLR